MKIEERLINERKNRVIRTIRREEADKPPFMFIADGYYPIFEGTDKCDVDTYDKAKDIVTKVTKDLNYDVTLMPFMPANLAVAPILEILGGGSYVVKECSKQILPQNVKIMKAEEYPELIKDPMKYILNTALPRRLKLLKNRNTNEKKTELYKTMDMKKNFGQFVNEVEEDGTLVMMSSVIMSPVDYILDFLRDFSGIMNDIKRNPDYVRDAGMSILQDIKLIAKSLPKNILDNDYKAVFIPMHLPAFLSPKDFEKVYWPSFKGWVEFLVEEGHNVVCYFEKKYSHLYDYLQELPKKGVVGLFQEDDLRIAKKKLGSTMAIAGGLSTSIMQNGTKDDCLNHVKGLIQDLCPGGGYFIAPDTPMMFSVDAKLENLKFIADYILESGK